MIESESDEDDGIEYKIAFEKDGPCVPVSESFGFPSDKTLIDSSNSKPSNSSNDLTVKKRSLEETRIFRDSKTSKLSTRLLTTDSLIPNLVLKEVTSPCPKIVDKAHDSSDFRISEQSKPETRITRNPRNSPLRSVQIGMNSVPYDYSVDKQGNRNSKPWLKQVLCRFFVNGMCRAGEKCNFGHDLSLSNKRTKSTELMIENVQELPNSIDKIDTFENATVKNSEQSIRIFRDPKTLQLSSGNAEICPEPATRISPIANNLTEGGTYPQLPKQPRFFVHMYFKLI